MIDRIIDFYRINIRFKWNNIQVLALSPSIWHPCVLWQIGSLSYLMMPWLLISPSSCHQQAIVSYPVCPVDAGMVQFRRVLTQFFPFPYFPSWWVLWKHDLFLNINVKNYEKYLQVTFYPSALRAGGVLSSRFGRAAGRAAAKLAEPISL